MARVSLETAHARRVQVHDLRSQGLSLRSIAAQLSLPLASVQNYLSVSPDLAAPLVAALGQAVALKSNPVNAHRGALELHTLAGCAGVSHRTIARRVKHLARKGAHRSSKRAPYHTSTKPAQYLDQWQMDTKKLRVDGVLVELLVCRDVYTGCTVVMRHSATHTGMLHKVALLFSMFGGVPKVFQTDNGTTDFSMARRDLLRPWHKLAFARGVERVQFIPEAEPRRNGSVESFNNWLANEWDNHGSSLGITINNFDEWLSDRLHYYNFVKPLGTTGKVPFSLSGGRFNLDVEDYDVEFQEVNTGCVSFIRYVSRSVDRASGAIAAVAPVKSPGTVFVVPHQFEGGYLRFDWYVDGRGVCVAPREVDTQAAIASGPKVAARRLVGRDDPALVVGSFVSPLVNPLAEVVQVVIADEVAAEFTPVVTDPKAILRTWKKILKQSIPELLPSGIDLVVGSDGQWQAWKGEDLLWTEQSSPEVLEHARELM